MFRIDRSRVNISDIRELQVNLINSEVTTSEQPEQPQEPQPDAIEIAQQKAEELIQRAESESDALRLRAEEVLRDAETEAEKLKTEAKQLGYELGYNEGRAEGEQCYDTLIADHTDAFKNAIVELKRAGESMITDMESDIIDMCFSVLHKIAALDRSSDGAIFKSIIKNAISQVDLTGKVSIRLSHEDCERFFPDGEAVFYINDSPVTASVLSDPGFTEGDIAVDTDSETVIAGAETQLRNIELSFRYRMGKDNE